MIGEDLDRILLAPGGGQTSAWRWGTVTQVAPLRVRLDGEAGALDALPASIAAGLRAGDRVWVQIAGRRLVVHGSNRQQASGPFDVTTDSLGYATVTHGLGFTPDRVGAMLAGNTMSGPDFPQVVLTNSFTATTFQVRIFGNVSSVAMSTWASRAATGLWVAA